MFINLHFEIYQKSMEKKVEHEGIVASICGNTLIVRIITSSVCGGCAARGYCVPAGNNDKEIAIKDFSGDFVSGERVMVAMQQSLGVRALCIGYLIPLAVAVASLLVVYQITGNELASGLLALFLMVPYYLLLKLFNQKFEKTFRFTVKKI